jgi:hypothetical protein
MNVQMLNAGMLPLSSHVCIVHFAECNVQISVDFFRVNTDILGPLVSLLTCYHSELHTLWQLAQDHTQVIICSTPQHSTAHMQAHK